MIALLAQQQRLLKRRATRQAGARRVKLQGADPSRTLTLRNRWARDLDARFRELRRWVRESVVERDCFGLALDRPVLVLSAAPPRAFAYRSDAEKIKGFMAWLQEQLRRGVLELTSGTPLNPEAPWTDAYVRSAYAAGLAQARAELRAQGIDLPSFETVQGGLSGVMYQPVHAERAATLYTRVWEDLQGVTSAMSTQMSRVLSQAMIEGVGPMEMAKRLTERVDAIGIVRARTIARTETIRAHSVASLTEYRAASAVIGKEVKCQWWTALDERVRATHQERHGNVYTEEEVLPLLGEPNCRCSLLPVTDEEAPPL